MAVPEYRTGDNYPPITGTVTDGAGAAVNISTAVSVRFVAVSGATVITGSTTNLDVGDVPTRGTWRYSWGASDLSVAATYEFEIEVTWPSSKIQTFPSSKLRAPTFLVTADND
jgi:hypothetical protein